MSDKAPEKKPDAAAAPAADKKDKDGGAGGAGGAKAGGKAGMMAMLSKTPVMLGGAMIIEAIVLFAGFKFLGGGPKAAAASAEIVASAEHGGAEAAHGEGEHGEGEHGAAGGAVVTDPKKVAEVEVLNFRAPNKLSGKTFIYDVGIYAVVRGSNEKSVSETIKDRKNLITDRIRTIIAQTDPEKLGGGSEPGLETLRRQVKYQLDQIVGEGMIDEVLVPRCIPYRTDN